MPLLLSTSFDDFEVKRTIFLARTMIFNFFFSVQLLHMKEFKSSLRAILTVRTRSIPARRNWARAGMVEWNGISCFSDFPEF